VILGRCGKFNEEVVGVAIFPAFNLFFIVVLCAFFIFLSLFASPVFLFFFLALTILFFLIWLLQHSNLQADVQCLLQLFLHLDPSFLQCTWWSFGVIILLLVKLFGMYAGWNGLLLKYEPPNGCCCCCCCCCCCLPLV